MSSIDLYNHFNDEIDAQDDYSGEDENPENSDPIKKSDNEDKIGILSVEPKVIRAKRKLFTLNSERLKGPRGIVAIDDFFKDIKFKGKGYEKQDIENVMKRLEHWAHRMYPKYNFDDSLAAIERLGKRKEVSIHMTRYRLDQLKEDVYETILPDIKDTDGKITEHSDLTIDEFDALIDEQIALTTLHPIDQNKSFGNTSSLMSQVNAEKLLALSSPSGSLPSSQHNHPSSQLSISDEIRAKVAENRKKALAIFEQRKKDKKSECEKKQANEITNIHIDDDDF